MRLVKARPWRHVFNFGLPDLVRDNSGGIALTGSTLAACHRTDGLSSPGWYQAKGVRSPKPSHQTATLLL